MTAVLEEKVGIMEITNHTKSKKTIIEVIRLNGNGFYKYQVRDGGIIRKKTEMTPDKLAKMLARNYERKGMKGQIRWQYKPLNSKSYSLT